MELARSMFPGEYVKKPNKSQPDESDDDEELKEIFEKFFNICKYGRVTEGPPITEKQRSHKDALMDCSINSRNRKEEPEDLKINNDKEVNLVIKEITRSTNILTDNLEYSTQQVEILKQIMKQHEILPRCTNKPAESEEVSEMSLLKSMARSINLLTDYIARSKEQAVTLRRNLESFEVLAECSKKTEESKEKSAKMFEAELADQRTETTIILGGPSKKSSSSASISGTPGKIFSRDDRVQSRGDQYKRSNFYKCHHCEFRAKIQQKVAAHTRLCHKKRLNCNECSFTCTSILELKRHNRAKHGTYKCQERSFKSSYGKGSPSKQSSSSASNSGTNGKIFSRDDRAQSPGDQYKRSKLYKCHHCEFRAKIQQKVAVHTRLCHKKSLVELQ